MSSNPKLDAIRGYLHNEIKPLLPSGWDIKLGLATPSTISRPTVYLEYARIAPLKEAPIGHAMCEIELTIVSPLTDLGKAEGAIDTAVVDLILALDGHSKITWSEAVKKTIAEASLGWTVSVSMPVEISKS